MDSDLERCKAAAAELGEYFDTVQIIVTRHEPTIEGGTIKAHGSAGNYFGRLGSVRSWLIEQDEGIRQQERQESE